MRRRLVTAQFALAKCAFFINCAETKIHYQENNYYVQQFVFAAAAPIFREGFAETMQRWFVMRLFYL